MEWKYSRQTNHIHVVHMGYIAVVSLGKTMSGYWGNVSKIEGYQVPLLAGKFAESIELAVDWAEAFIALQIVEAQVKDAPK
jgi:hypothetical protein